MFAEAQMAKSTATRQTSNKAGVASGSKKMANTRDGFATQPASRKAGGAFGQEQGTSPMKNKPGTASTRAGKASALRRVKSS
jgi:hypothetical protein